MGWCQEASRGAGREQEGQLAILMSLVLVTGALIALSRFLYRPLRKGQFEISNFVVYKPRPNHTHTNRMRYNYNQMSAVAKILRRFTYAAIHTAHTTAKKGMELLGKKNSLEGGARAWQTAAF